LIRLRIADIVCNRNEGTGFRSSDIYGYSRRVR
jgi:hypothetical protein